VGEQEAGGIARALLTRSSDRPVITDRLAPTLPLPSPSVDPLFLLQLLLHDSSSAEASCTTPQRRNKLFAVCMAVMLFTVTAAVVKQPQRSHIVAGT
jgi:hypothetical protein